MCRPLNRTNRWILPLEFLLTRDVNNPIANIKETERSRKYDSGDSIDVRNTVDVSFDSFTVPSTPTSRFSLASSPADIKHRV